jgi:hypothetical protein
MSNTLSSVQQELFDSAVKHEYQALKSTLRDTVTLRTGITADKYDFRLMGKGAATARTGASADVVPMNVAHSLIQCTLTDWEAPEYTDIFNQAGVNFQEVNHLARTIAGALGRRQDQLIIDAIEAKATNQVVNGGTGLTVAKLAQAKEQLDSVEADESQRFMLIDHVGLRQLLADTTLTSADYNTVKALVNGDVNTFMGFNFKRIGTRSEGGLTTATDVRTALAYHAPSIGYAESLMSTRVDWVAHKASWLSLGMLKAGSVGIDADGLVKVDYDITA